MTISIVIHRTMTSSIVTNSIMTLSYTTSGVMTPSIKKIVIMTLSIAIDTQNNIYFVRHATFFFTFKLSVVTPRWL